MDLWHTLFFRFCTNSHQIFLWHFLCLNICFWDSKSCFSPVKLKKNFFKYIENIIFFVLLQTENGYVSPLT